MNRQPCDDNCEPFLVSETAGSKSFDPIFLSRLLGESCSKATPQRYAERSSLLVVKSLQPPSAPFFPAACGNNHMRLQDQAFGGLAETTANRHRCPTPPTAQHDSIGSFCPCHIILSKDDVVDGNTAMGGNAVLEQPAPD